MNDGTIVAIVSGSITIVGMVVGFLTLWLKLRYGAEKAEEAAVKARQVEGKLDANTVTTNAVDLKTDAIVRQTNGAADRMRLLVESIAERVGNLEVYNRESSHRAFDAIQTLSLKVERLLALQDAKPPPAKREA